MKRGKQNQNHGGGSGGRAAATVAIGDRVTYAESFAAGSVGGPTTVTGALSETGDGGRGGEIGDNTAKASLSIAKTWNEGRTNIPEARFPAIGPAARGSGAGAAARVPDCSTRGAARISEWGGEAARVSEWGGEFYSQNF